MRELKTYISEGFFNNVGANNRIKLAIDTIKDASLNDKIDSEIDSRKFINSLTSILRGIETDIKKGKFAFEYIRNDETSKNSKITISLEIDGSNDIRWLYGNKYEYGRYAIYFHADSIVSNVANDLYYETTHPTRDSKFRHSIAKTIKVTEFKLS